MQVSAMCLGSRTLTLTTRATLSRAAASTSYPSRRALAATASAKISLLPSSAAVCCSSPSAALVCSSRTFYDKIREHRDGSDEGPDQMFEGFAKSPHRQRVPVELHKGNRDAVDGAETLNRFFFVILIFVMSGTLYFLNPFRGEPYERPEGYGVTDPKHVSGTSKGL